LLNFYNKYLQAGDLFSGFFVLENESRPLGVLKTRKVFFIYSKLINNQDSYFLMLIDKA